MRSNPESNALPNALKRRDEELEARVESLEAIAKLDEGPRYSSRVRIRSNDTLAFDTTAERAKSALKRVTRVTYSWDATSSVKSEWKLAAAWQKRWL